MPFFTVRNPVTNGNLLLLLLLLLLLFVCLFVCLQIVSHAPVGVLVGLLVGMLGEMVSPASISTSLLSQCLLDAQAAWPCQVI
jgi:hypothetical protein